MAKIHNFSVASVNRLSPLYPDSKCREYKRAFGKWPPMMQWYISWLSTKSDKELAEQFGVVRNPGRDPPFEQPNLKLPSETLLASVA